MSENKRQPMQPVVLDAHGVLRFHQNAIVRYLLDHGGIDLNRIAMLQFPREDREQFAQLIGYSISGFSELGYASNETVHAANLMYEQGMSALEARVQALEETLAQVRAGLREAAVAAFPIHPEDLQP